jgi:Calcineurin-like phosphoesterase
MDVPAKDTETEVDLEDSVASGSGKPIRILHISDLHFGRTFDPALWEYIGAVLTGSEKPDVIAVTGDLVDTPSFFMLGMARRELQMMRDRWCTPGRECELIVIPGNHDVAIAGNLAFWPWRVKFSVVFGSKTHQVFDRLPTFCSYRSWKWYKRWAVRGAWTMKFAGLRLAGRLRAQVPGALTREAAKRRLCFASLDSNGQMFLASGRVLHASILALHGELIKRWLPGEDRKLMSLVPRIALVHHHVIPIPYSSSIESLTEFEPFLVLRNAGTLLRELCERDFDLVLHGHKHFLNFARLTFGSADNARNEIAILAAGSATTGQTGAGQNSFNLLKVYPSGSISFRSVRYGQGRSGGGTGAWQEGFQRLLSLDDLKRRVHARAQMGQLISCDIREALYQINEEGSANVTVRVAGLKCADDERLRRRHQRMSVGYGAIDPDSVHLNQDSVNAGHYIEGLPKVPSHRVEFRLLLGGASIASERGSAYELSCRFLSSFAITQWESRAMSGSESRDWVGASVRIPTKMFRLSVELPRSFKNPDPQVIVERQADYPLLTLNDVGEVEALPGGTWVRDPDMTELEKGQLRHANERWTLEVNHPLVGHRYIINWNIESRSIRTTSERQSLALQLRRSLGELCNAESEPALGVAKLAREILCKITEEILRPLVGTRYAFHERLEAAIFVYDDVQTCLKLVANSLQPAESASVVSEIPLNGGVAGAAFKCRRVKIYVCPECAGKGGVYLYFPETMPEALKPDYSALIAFPLHLGDLFPAEWHKEQSDLQVAPEELIGVFAIASTARDSRLVSLGVEAEHPDPLQRQLTNDIWAVAAQYFRGISDAIRNTGTRH